MKISACFLAFVLFSGLSLAASAEEPNYSISGSVWGDVYFDAGSYALTEKDRKDLTAVYEWIKKHPGSTVLLAGYDDQRTPEDQSVELGWKRAGAVKDFLVSLGTAPDSVHEISFGNTRAAYTGTGEDVWAKNRRVRYRVVGPEDTGKMEGKPSGVCQRCKK